jgi:putative transposase
MMTDSEFSVWCAQVGLTPEGIELARLIRTSEPSRRSRGHTNNVRGRYPSRKMGKTREFDSHTCELHFIYHAEHHAKIREYWEQPPAIKIVYELQGKRRGQQYIADFAVFMEERLIFVECKPEELLIEKAKRMPGFVYKEEGVWRCPPIEEALATKGIGFLIWTPEAAQVFSRNLAFHQDYYLHGFPEVPKEIIDGVLGIATERRRVRLDELPGLVKGLTHDHLNAMILSRQVFVDLYQDVLAHRHGVWVYPDEETALAINGTLLCVKAPQLRGPIPVVEETGQTVKWGEALLSIVMVTNDKIYLRKGDEQVNLPRSEWDGYIADGTIQGSTRTGEHPVVEEVTSLILSKSTKDLNEALVKLHTIQGGETTLSKRQVRRLARAAKLAKEAFGSEIYGLIPNHDAKGNRTPKLPEAVYVIADQIIEDAYQTFTAPNKRAAHALFQGKCKAANFPDGASYTWFAARIKAMPQKAIVESRLGRRVAYSKFGFNYCLTRDCPPHGDHPWDVGHVDHTELDIEALLSGGHLRAWLTTFWLSFPRKLVAYWIHFGSPSKVAAMTVIRLCLKKYGRVPSNIVVDNGKEFLSTDFQTLLATLGATVKYRPPAQARSGSVLESAFHALNCHLIHNLPGNTKIMRNVRQVTKSVLPSNLAKLSLTEIDHKVGAYYDIVNDVIHPALEDTPNDYYARHMQLLGQRGHMFRPWTDELYKLTLPSMGDRTVKPQGVKFKYFYYNNAILANYHGKELPVRYDPLDIRSIFVQVEPKWIACTCPHLSYKVARSVAQLKLATAAMFANIGNVIKRRQIDIATRVLPYLELMPSEPVIKPGGDPSKTVIEVQPLPPNELVVIPPDTKLPAPTTAIEDAPPNEDNDNENGGPNFTILPTEDV